jgi:aspartyl-tRNA(Asn)/glutamyl-tRNA(Gln) amidotransferase subunit C
MASPLRREDVAKVAKLARLSLSAEELDMFTEQLGQILEHANDIAALQLDEVIPTAHPFGLINVVREDVIEPSLPREDLLAMAPDAEDGRFAVPRIMGEAP